MQYDSNTGSITGKSDAGTLLYENSEKPYALTGVDPSTSLVPEADQALTYTSFGSVHTISEDADSAVFVYNSDGERIKMMVLHNGSHEVTKWYSGSSFMKDSVSGTARSFTYIGGDAYSAPVVARKQGSSVTYYYLLRDHLGSITHVVDSTGSSVTAEYSYDSWGRMRNPQTWENYSPGSEPVLFSGRGFTGHEHLPWFNLINMNGRVYDPLTGGFLSPDPFMQSPDITQNYNRFTYCMNNPLIYTDPCGFRKKCPGEGGIEPGSFLWDLMQFWQKIKRALHDDSSQSNTPDMADSGDNIALYSYMIYLNSEGFQSESSGPSVGGGGGDGGISGQTNQTSRQQIFKKDALRTISRSIGIRTESLPLGKITKYILYSYLQFTGSLTDYPGAPCQYVNGYIDWIDVYSDGLEFQNSSWKAVSGPWNGPPSYKGRVDVGSFFLSGPIDADRLRDPGFKRDGVKFAFGIYNDIWIHPDGNAFGSLGCIVLQENASKLMLFYNRTSNYMCNHNKINLIVSY
jgi:RHS repeat-associated protein